MSSHPMPPRSLGNLLIGAMRFSGAHCVNSASRELISISEKISYIEMGERLASVRVVI